MATRLTWLYRIALQVQMALFGRLRAADIAAELRAQLFILRDHGVRISHLDSHGHLHKFPAIARAIRPVLGELGITKLRRPQNLYKARSFRDALDYYCAVCFPRFVTTDYFYTPGKNELDWLRNLPSFIPVGVTELGIHPGHVEAWRRSETEPFFALDPDAFRNAGVELVSYHQLA